MERCGRCEGYEKSGSLCAPCGCGRRGWESRKWGEAILEAGISLGNDDVVLDEGGGSRGRDK